VVAYFVGFGAEGFVLCGRAGLFCVCFGLLDGRWLWCAGLVSDSLQLVDEIGQDIWVHSSWCPEMESLAFVCGRVHSNIVHR